MNILLQSSVDPFLARLAACNLWYATSAAKDLVLRTPRERLAAALLRLSGHRAATQGTPPLQSIRASQQEIADLANVSRTTASGLLHDFQDAGLITLDYRRIGILVAEGLAATLDT